MILTLGYAARESRGLDSLLLVQTTRNIDDRPLRMAGLMSVYGAPVTSGCGWNAV